MEESLHEEDRFHLELMLSYWNPGEKDDRMKLVQWFSYALSIFQRYFVEDIEKLITEHQRDSLDEEGNLFWGG
jgi:hypothetical protein